MGSKSLIWRGPLLDCSGYAAAGRGYIRAADEASVAIQVRDRSRSVNLKDKGMDGDIMRLYDRLYKTVVPHDSPSLQHQVPDAFYRDHRARWCGAFTIFEMTRIPDEWVPRCNMMDEIWTGSEYSKASFEASGVKVPVKVIPHALDTWALTPEGPKWEIANRRKFAFLSVFDFTERKAWKDLLRAFWTAFGPEDDVCLILKVYFGNFSDEARAEILRKICLYKRDAGFDRTAPILVYGHDVPGNAMPALYRAADCYVGLSREGFGLGFAEAMACGIPCIGPSVGGNTEFMKQDNSFLIDFVKNEPVSKEMSLIDSRFGNLEWFVHSWEHLASTMRSVVSDDDRRRRIGQAGLDYVRQNLNIVAIGRRLEGLLPG